MHKYFLGRTRHIVVSLRFGLLAIFIGIFSFLIITLMGLFYYHTTDLVLNASMLLMEKTSSNILRQFDSQLQPIEMTNRLSAASIEGKVLDIDDKNEMMLYLAHALSNLDLAQGMFWATTDGDFIYAKKNLQNQLSVGFVNQRSSPAKHYYRDFSEDNLMGAMRSSTIDFDPRKRTWYKLGVEKKKTAWTDVYEYDASRSLIGISVVTPVYINKKLIGVFGTDVRLDGIAQYIADRKIGDHGEILIYNKQGNVIVVPEYRAEKKAFVRHAVPGKKPHPPREPWIRQAYEIYKESSESVFTFENAGRKYLATFSPIPILSENGWVIGIVDLASDFTSSIHRAEFAYVLVNVIIFLLGIWLISHFVTRLIVPIRKLVKETEKIKNFKLSGTESTESRIKEVIEISNAIQSMKIGLRSFEKYVPASLVRQLIKAGEDVYIGGTKRELAVFFSDINNFTTITEKTDSNLLMKQMCEYLDAFSHIIVNSKGTIDKFIGDAIMSFWGAPLFLDSPCENAASAALDCMAQQKKLNKEWMDSGRPVFITRIGIHFGEAIVGNMGSSERLNYTALGDTINIASRLVSVNKLYGTSILVSETVHERLNLTFILRFVDEVILKGKAKSTPIFELLGRKGEHLGFDLDAYQKMFSLGFEKYQSQHWQQSIECFMECLKIYPEDTLAVVFMKRCSVFCESPPQNWDGIWRLTEK